MNPYYTKKVNLPESNKPIFIKVKDGYSGLHSYVALYKEQFYLCLDTNLWIKCENRFFLTDSEIDSEMWQLMKGSFEDNGIHLNKEISNLLRQRSNRNLSVNEK